MMNRNIQTYKKAVPVQRIKGNTHIKFLPCYFELSYIYNNWWQYSSSGRIRSRTNGGN